MAIFGRVQKVDTSWGASLGGIDSTSLWGKIGNWKRSKTGWPLVGNEGINLYIGILGIHSLIPY